MPKSHRPYPSEFRQRLIELVRKGRTPEELSRQFERRRRRSGGWVKQAALDAGERSHGLTAEHEELRRLRREVRQLREERVILCGARGSCPAPQLL
jgi:transposase